MITAIRSIKFTHTILMHKGYATNSFKPLVWKRTITVKRIGFIGLGQMGLHMAKNLYLKSEYPISVLDSDPKRHMQLVDIINLSQVKKSSSNKSKDINARLKNVTKIESLNDCNVILSMLPNSDIVNKVYFEDNLFKLVQKNTYFIDCSTIAPDKAKDIHNRLKENDMIFVDAPVSGGVIGADLGTLSFMVGSSDKKTFLNVEKIVLNMGSKAYNCLGTGKGQVAKLCNNMLLGISMIGLSEALTIANNMDFDLNLLVNIINSSTGRCWASERNCPVPHTLDLDIPCNNGYKGGFNIKLLEKDLNLACELAAQSNSPQFLGALALQIYRKLGAMDEYKNLDFGAVFKWLSNNNINSQKNNKKTSKR